MVAPWPGLVDGRSRRPKSVPGRLRSAPLASPEALRAVPLLPASVDYTPYLDDSATVATLQGSI